MFRAFSTSVSYYAGRPIAFALASLTVLVWAATGPVFHYSDTWQLVINTGTTVITFMMVFLIQASQNRDAMAIQLKLDELLRAIDAARNVVIAAEDLPEDEILSLKSSVQPEP